MKGRKNGESDADYIRRLESRNESLKRHNDEAKRWANALSEAVRALSTEASTAFQLMAEKAGVRSHPSVTKAVELFDMVAFPRWRQEGEKMPKIEFPDDWDLDGEDAWSGDADMSLNAPLAEACEIIETLCHRPNADGALRRVQMLIQKACEKGIEGAKKDAGFVPREITLSPSQMSEIGWVALDLAQDMHFANNMLRRDLRAATYRRICDDLYALAFPQKYDQPQKFNIKVIGGTQEPF